MRLIENFSIISFEDFLGNPLKWDVFFSCGSFEERCLRSSELVKDSQIEILDSIIFNYPESDPENRKEDNIETMKSNLEQSSKNVHVFDSESVSFPSQGIKKFLEFIKEKDICLEEKQIAVDVSTFTKAYFFLLFKVLKEKFGITKFWVIYTEPEKYKTKDPRSGEIILTEGTDRVETIPGFSGSSVNSKDSLIVLLGFEGKRSMEVFDTISPEITYAVNGFPSYQSGWHKISLEANLRFLKESGAHNSLFLAPAIDPFETKKLLLKITNEIKEKYPKLNIVIAPLGTKMQAFGVLLHALQDQSVKVIYPFPSFYKADYSYRFGPTWIFKLDLERFALK